jgi:hypothetical protein
VELHLHPTYLPSWCEQGKLHFFASVSQIFRSCGLQGALLKLLTDGLNVGRLSKSDAGTHSWLPLLTAVRGVIEIMPLSLQNKIPIPVAEFSNISRLCCAQLGSMQNKEGLTGVFIAVPWMHLMPAFTATVYSGTRPNLV